MAARIVIEVNDQGRCSLTVLGKISHSNAVRALLGAVQDVFDQQQRELFDLKASRIEVPRPDFDAEKLAEAVKATGG